MTESIKDTLLEIYIWLILIFLGFVLFLDLFFVGSFSENLPKSDVKIFDRFDEEVVLDAPSTFNIQQDSLFSPMENTLSEPLPSAWSFTGASVDVLMQTQSISTSAGS